MSVNLIDFLLAVPHIIKEEVVVVLCEDVDAVDIQYEILCNVELILAPLPAEALLGQAVKEGSTLIEVATSKRLHLGLWSLVLIPDERHPQDCELADPPELANVTFEFVNLVIRDRDFEVEKQVLVIVEVHVELLRVDGVHADSEAEGEVKGGDRGHYHRLRIRALFLHLDGNERPGRVLVMWSQVLLVQRLSVPSDLL